MSKVKILRSSLTGKGKQSDRAMVHMPKLTSTGELKVTNNDDKRQTNKPELSLTVK